MIGESAGLNLRKEGGAGMPAGSRGITAAMAVCTSTAALSMSRLRSNCSVTLLLPVELDELISSMPAIVVNCRSSGLATDDAIVPGSPPGNPALTFNVGKSTFGRSLTGSSLYASTPNTAMPSMIRLVAIGRLIKISEMFTARARIDQYHRSIRCAVMFLLCLRNGEVERPFRAAIPAGPERPGLQLLHCISA